MTDYKQFEKAVDMYIDRLYTVRKMRDFAKTYPDLDWGDYSALAHGWKLRPIVVKRYPNLHQD